MATNLEINPKLMNQALNYSPKKTKRAVVEEALQEYVARREQQKVISLFGTMDYHPSFNYKSQRQRP